VSARLLDEERGLATLDEVTFAVESLDASRENKGEDLRLDTHDKFEGSETLLLLLESGLREEIQNNLELVKKRCFLNRKISEKRYGLV
jgi:hypothetical protein